MNEGDFTGIDEFIVNIILKALAHDYTKRPENGRELLELVNDATINR